MRRYKRYGIINLIVFGVFLLAASHYGWLSQPANKAMQSQPGLYPVKQFVDGDTVVVDMNGRPETIRMIGVDTPETHKPATPVQCYGPEASAYTKTLIGNSLVRLEADPLDTNRDRYGRLLRYVFLPDGTLVEAKLISEGYGFAYTQFPFQKKDQFVASEHTAKQASRGLWAACQVSVEAGGREQTQPR
jgi:endonuclease YncB( thermonuclease family)